MNLRKEWVLMAAYMVIAVIILSSVLGAVTLDNEGHNIVPADTVNVDGQIFDVLDILTDSGMDRTSTELSRFSSLNNLNEIVGQEGNDNIYSYWGGERIGMPADNMMFAEADSSSQAGSTDTTY